MWINKTRLISKLNWKTKINNNFKSPTIGNLYCIKFNIQHFRSCLSSARIRIAILHWEKSSEWSNHLGGEIRKPQVMDKEKFNLLSHSSIENMPIHWLFNVHGTFSFVFFSYERNSWEYLIHISHYSLAIVIIVWVWSLNQLLNFHNNEIQARSSNIQLEMMHSALTFLSNVAKFYSIALASQLFT